MARVIIPATEEFLKKYGGEAYGKRVYRPYEDRMARYANVVGFIDKLAQSPALTAAAEGVSKVGGAAIDAFKNYQAEQDRQAEVQKMSPEGIAGYDVTIGMTDEQKRAYGAMTPEQKMRYTAAKRKAEVDAEKASFLQEAGRFAGAQQQYLDQLKQREDAGAEMAGMVRRLGDDREAGLKKYVDEMKAKITKEFEATEATRREVERPIMARLEALKANADDPANAAEIKKLTTELQKLNDEKAAARALYNQQMQGGGDFMLDQDRREKYERFKKAQEKFLQGVRDKYVVQTTAVPGEMVAEPLPPQVRAQPPVFSVPGAPVSTTPAPRAPVGGPPGAPAAPATPQVDTRPTVTYPEGAVGQGPATFAGADDIVKQIQNERDPKKQEELIRKLAMQSAGMLGAAGTEAAPMTKPTQYADVQRTQLRPELAEPTKLALEQELTPDDVRLMREYGLDVAGVKRFRTMEGLEEPGKSVSESLATIEQITSAAKVADTPEKQRMVLDAVKNVKFTPRNVFEAFGFGQADPGRRTELALSVDKLFPKKTASDLYYENLLKQEKARATAEKTKTEVASRPAVVAEKEVAVKKADYSIGLTAEQIRAKAADIRTEDDERGLRIYKALMDNYNDQERAKAAMKAASRARGGGSRQPFWEKEALLNLQKSHERRQGHLKQAGEFSKSAKDLSEEAGKGPTEQEIKEAEDRLARAPSEKKAAAPGMTQAAKARADAQKSLDELRKRKARADAAAKARDEALQKAKEAEDKAEEEKANQRVYRKKLNLPVEESP